MVTESAELSPSNIFSSAAVMVKAVPAKLVVPVKSVFFAITFPVPFGVILILPFAPSEIVRSPVVAFPVLIIISVSPTD